MEQASFFTCFGLIIIPSITSYSQFTGTQLSRTSQQLECFLHYISGNHSPKTEKKQRERIYSNALTSRFYPGSLHTLISLPSFKSVLFYKKERMSQSSSMNSVMRFGITNTDQESSMPGTAGGIKSSKTWFPPSENFQSRQEDSLIFIQRERANLYEGCFLKDPQ